MDTAEQDHCAAELVLQLIDQGQQRLAVLTVQACRQDFHTLDVQGRGRQIVARRAGCLGLQLLQLFLQGAIALQHSGQLVDQVVAAALDQAGRFLELFFSGIEVGQGRSACHCLNTAHTRSHAAFADDFHQGDVTGTVGVDTATQFHRKIAAHAQYAHTVAVLLAEQRHGALGLGGLDVGFFGLHRGVLADLRVDDVFQRLDLLRLDRFEVAEVETQTLAIHQRAFLLDVIAQDLAQRRVQQVRGRVVQCSGVAYVSIDLGIDPRTNRQVAQHHHTVMQERTARLGGVAHVKTTRRRTQEATVTDLATGFGVERGLVQDHHRVFAFVQHVDRLAVFIDGDDLGRAHGGVVAGELCRCVNLDQGVVVQAKRAGGTRTHTLGFHLTLKTGFVDGQLALTGDVGGQVHRETVGVVQLEHHVARHHGALEASQILLENFQAVVQGLGELLLLSLEHALDIALLLLEFREGLAHLGNQCRNDLVEEAAGGAQLVTVAAGATDDAAQHITAAFVRRQHAIGDQEAAGTDVVRYHLERRLAFIGAANGRRRGAQQVGEQVDLVVGMHVLHHRTDPLQAHAGVDRRRWQRMQHAIGGAVELHEHVIPDLDVTVAVFFRRARWATPDVGAVVVENLGARAARAGIAHGPEVVGSVRRAFVVADTDHALLRHADVLGPDVIRFVVRRVDGDPEFFLRQLQHTGQEGPGEGDRIFLEIVAKAEVAQHFEERVVTRGVTDVFQVTVLAAGAYALLAAGGAGVGALFLAQETVLELVHPRVGEQQGWVIAWDQRAGGYTGVALLFEEAKEGFTDFCAFH